MEKRKLYIKIIFGLGIIMTLAGYIYLIEKTTELYKELKFLDRDISQKKMMNQELKEERLRLIDSNKILTYANEAALNTLLASKDIKSKEEAVKIIQKMNDQIGYNFVVTDAKKFNAEMARRYEIDGFNYLLKRDVDRAIISFVKCENSYNQYHQAYEIAKYLKKQRKELTKENLEKWRNVYIEICSKYSYGMPEYIKIKMKNTYKNK